MISRPVALALTALAIGFNLPFQQLATTFDYPGILREDPATILDRFAAGGPSLILTWYAFAFAALMFLPVGMAHALGAGRMAQSPALAVAAAVTAALAGVMQAMGLLRWVMVVPGLAASGDVEGFALIHAFGGVAVGEHLGQSLTAAHVGLIALIQWRERRWPTAVLGALTVALILAGSLEGVALAIGRSGEAFGLMAVAGYLGLTLWMLASALGLSGLRLPRPAVA